MRFKPDGSDGQIIANGLRNSVGLDWSPWDNALYATENGRDLLGDDSPNEELNRIQPGGFYGWPYVHGFGVVDPKFGVDQAQRITTSIAPVHGFRAHNAPLGIRFLRKPAPGFERSALVALHGSWNRSTPDGYKVVSLHWDAAGKIEEKEFLTGFLGANSVIGRPVDVAEGSDGAIYVSDDLAGVIYRVTRTAN
jgi:glucose/arabinose dehydrogenase